jgi:deoxyribodipyrimidine photo-lyase
MSSAIHWFRRDLRLSDNTALNAALAAHDLVVPVYVLSTWKGAHRWTGPGRQRFLCEALASLHAGLSEAGGRLVVRAGDAVEELSALVRETGATAIYANRDPDPYGQEVEARLAAKARELGVNLHLCKDAALHEREEVLTGAASPFRVFTPYSRAWAKLDKASPGPTVARISVPSTVASLPLPGLAHWGLEPDSTSIPPASEAAAAARLERFLEAAVVEYAAQRDLPAVEGTSRISQDLRFGLLSIRTVYARVAERLRELGPERGRSVQIYINELCWREFYFQVLWHAPHVLAQEYGVAYRGLPWTQDPAALERWCQGQTGFPIVDAGMRQLLSTGFMHNRVRMITAMFLTKDLHQDWRAGEQWFMQRLLDGEIASNNGGWQWSAGTGTDAAPYFRIQNPWTQSERFDPQALYIKRWVPELRDVSGARLHQPPSPGLRFHRDYPLPMVEHGRERLASLQIYKEHLAKTR